MPWRQEPMKDVAGCEKLRGVASRHRSGGVRMGKPDWRSPVHPWLDQIRQREARRPPEYRVEGLSCGNLGGPPAKAKCSWRPIVNEYREGKVKSTPIRGVK